MAKDARKKMTFEARTWTDERGHVFLKDVDRHERVKCSECRRFDELWEGHVIIVRREGEPEQIFCSGCWPKKKASIEWIGAVCAIVFHGLLTQLVYAQHEMLGTAFDRLTKLDIDAVLLFAPSRKERQPDMFMEASS
jgi:hypothetical protein